MRPAIAVSCAFGKIFTVVESEVVASGFGVGVNVLEQAGADVEFLGCPRRLGGVFVQAEVGDGLLGGVNLALLLVVIKKAGGGVEVFGIGEQRGVGVVAELAQVLRVAEEIEITLDELRVPERLESSARRRRVLREPILGDIRPSPSPSRERSGRWEIACGSRRSSCVAAEYSFCATRNCRKRA